MNNTILPIHEVFFAGRSAPAFGAPVASTSLLTCVSFRYSSKHLVRVCWGGRADRTRTCNLRFWRPLLYQLSHRPRRAAITHLTEPEPCETGIEKLCDLATS